MRKDIKSGNSESGICESALSAGKQVSSHWAPVGGWSLNVYCPTSWKLRGPCGFHGIVSLRIERKREGVRILARSAWAVEDMIAEISGPRYLFAHIFSLEGRRPFKMLVGRSPLTSAFGRILIATCVYSRTLLQRDAL